MQLPFTPLEVTAADALRLTALLGVIFRVMESCASLSFSSPLLGVASIGIVAPFNDAVVHLVQFGIQAVLGLVLTGVLLFASNRIREGSPRWTRRARQLSVFVIADVAFYLLGLLGGTGWLIFVRVRGSRDHLASAAANAWPQIFPLLFIGMEVGLLICAVRAHKLLQLLESVQPAPLPRG
ncbi:hypothetical protein AB0M43_20680 [Longispora sp. NPDC051575]|uniref:hypothetical protein n=1 Tax=Longispora sp. NPDC051575 TaxID=3154943 RepID=UPI0034271997